MADTTQPATTANPPHYAKDGVSLYHGDCADILPHLPQADLIVTSPPYSTLRDYGGNSTFSLARCSGAIVGAVKEGGTICWHVGDQVVDGGYLLGIERAAIRFVDEEGLLLHDRIAVITKRQGALAATRWIQNWDICYIFTKGKIKTFNAIEDKKNVTAGSKSRLLEGPGRIPNGGRNPGTGRLHTTPEYSKREAAWEVELRNDDHSHPAVMPQSLAADLIKAYSNPGDLVIDPFSGSGTTAREAQKLGREAIGIDIHLPYITQSRQHRFAQMLLFT